MPDTITRRHGADVLLCDADGPAVATVQDVLDVIGAAFAGAEVVAVPAARLDDRFFTLDNGFAGEVMQKFVNYHLRLVILGDITRHLTASRALRELVHECNRGRHVWFVADLDELDTRLAALNP